MMRLYFRWFKCVPIDLMLSFPRDGWMHQKRICSVPGARLVCRCLWRIG